MDPIMPLLVGGAFVVVLLGTLMRAAGQPQVVAYLVAGVVLGPSGFALIADQALIARMGEIGVVLLLFFIGMEISLPDLLKNWRVPTVGTVLQILASVATTWVIGAVVGWPVERIVVLGFVISLSSTAVVMRVLQSKGELDTDIGRDVVGVLLVQDIAVVPMMIAIATLGGMTQSPWRIGVQVLGGVGVVVALVMLARSRDFRLPFREKLRADPELQIFAAALVCFGVGLATGLMGLSVALGAFLAGIVVGAAKETEWVHHSLYPFHVVFLAVFFLSVGMLIDVAFLKERWLPISALVFGVLLTNTLVNASIFKALGRSTGNSIYGGAVLGQIGEFSFVLVAVAHQSGLVEDAAYQLTVLVIALSLLVSPTWIALFDRLRRRAQGAAA